MATRLCLYLMGFAVTVQLASQGTDCQEISCEGGRPINGVCYVLNEKLVTRQNAQDACVETGSFLAAVTDERTLRELQRFLEELDVTTAWLGAREEIESLWQWVSGGLDPPYLGPQGCYMDKPEDRDLRHLKLQNNTSAERCIEACRRDNFLYAATQDGNKCYCDNSFGSHGKAQKCVKKCADDSSDYSLWCGGENVNFVYRIGGSYARWGYNQPNNYRAENNATGYQMCAVLDTHIETRFADEQCHKHFSYICVFDAMRPSCSGTFSYGTYASVDGICYFISTDVRVSWFEARARCRGFRPPGSTNGDLAYIPNRYVHRRLSPHIRRAFDGEQTQVWVGLTTAKWSWQSSASGKQPEFSFTAWRAGSPDDGTENCMVMTYSQMDARYLWEDVDCSARYSFFCQADTMAPSTPTITKPFVTGTVGVISQTTAGFATWKVLVIVVVLLLLLLLVLIIVFCCWFFKKRNKESKVSHNDASARASRPSRHRVGEIPHYGNGSYDYYTGSKITLTS